MQEITRVFLENEMDVILAHKRSMRLAELAGLSLAGQTTFATAVSEVSRNAVEQSNSGQLILGIDDGGKKTEKFIVAQVQEEAHPGNDRRNEGFQYASRLVNSIHITQTAQESNIELRFRIHNAAHIQQQQIQQWILNFEQDLPASPYEEIKRKNRQLIGLTEKLRHSEQQYRSLTESLPLLVFSWTPGKGLTYINKWASDFTGMTLEELEASRWQTVYHPDDYADNMAGWERARREGVPLSGQMRLKQAASGEYLWHMSFMMPQKNNSHEITHWIGYCADIHAQKVIEQTLKDNKELIAIKQELEANQAELQLKVSQLNQSNEELERFAYVASHDLQEPLRKIIFYSDYLKKQYATLYDEQGAMFFNNMINATSRMQHLIRDVLAYSTIGRAPQQVGPVNLNALIRDALQDLELTVLDKQATIDVADLPEVPGDSLQLRQLFENLLGNALKYVRPDVPPRIHVSSVQDDKGMVHITVEDNGIGFDNRYLDRMFNLFQRLHTRDQFEGTGIGLAICKRVAELHGGFITGNGQVGKGAVFTVSLPLADTGA